MGKRKKNDHEGIHSTMYPLQQFLEQLVLDSCAIHVQTSWRWPLRRAELKLLVFFPWRLKAMSEFEEFEEKVLKNLNF